MDRETIKERADRAARNYLKAEERVMAQPTLHAEDVPRVRRCKQLATLLTHQYGPRVLLAQGVELENLTKRIMQAEAEAAWLLKTIDAREDRAALMEPEEETPVMAWGLLRIRSAAARADRAGTRRARRRMGQERSAGGDAAATQQGDASMMITIALVPLVIAVLGLFLYGWESRPKVKEVGRLIFLCGLMAFCLALMDTSATIRIGGVQ